MKHLLAIGALGCSLAACTASTSLPLGDDSGATFGGSGAKADGRYTDCELLEVMKLVNASDSTRDALASILQTSTGKEAAQSLVAHRDGPDGVLGTADDDVIEDLNELDSIAHVGPMALDRLVGAVANVCATDLASRPFIDSTTFAGSPGYSYPRSGVELESVHGVQGITGRQLREILLSQNSNGRTVYERIRKNRTMEAFTYEYGVNRMPWDRVSHEAREGLPLVALSIESGRYEASESDGSREISLGTDLMDDTYYDTRSYSLFENNILLRARARWDSPTEVRRLLIAAKFDTAVDDNGIKRNKKTDERAEGKEFLQTLDHDVRTGMVPWVGNPRPSVPIRAIYESLTSRQLLPDIAGHEDVLLLDAVAHLRSRRSRYHQNEAQISAVANLYDHGTRRISDVLEKITAAQASGALTGSDADAAASFAALAQRVADGSEIATRTGLDPSAYVLPARGPAPLSEEARVVASRRAAEAYSAALHELADLLEEFEETLVPEAEEEDDAEDAVDLFRSWQISRRSDLADVRVAAPFLEEYSRSLLAAFNAYGTAQQTASNYEFEDFTALDEAQWTDVGRELARQDLQEARRQIEAGGTSAITLWFDKAREHYVPESSRQTSNFMIDTFDMTDILTPAEWASIPLAERDFTRPLPAEKVIHTLLVNELQIELGCEKEFVDRIDALSAQIAAGDSTAETAQALEGAKFVFRAYVDAMSYLAELKGDRVLRLLRDAGAPSDIRWETTERAKGETALALLDTL